MMTNLILGALLIFLARVLNIAISTLRILMMARGRRLITGVLGFFEALLFALTISVVVQDLNNVWNLMGYSLGFAGGIVVGLAIEERLAMGFATVNVVSSNRGHDVAEAIREAGFGATETTGQGSEGTVGLVRTVVPRRYVKQVSDIANRADAASFVTVEETVAVRRGTLGLMRIRS
jgi:uncharacterized protein YebE (UPF0316 family)